MSKNLYMYEIGKKAKAAAHYLSNISIEKRNSVLKQFCIYLKTNSKSILRSNKKDIANAKFMKIEYSMIERLKLDNKKIEQIINSIKEIIKFIINKNYLDRTPFKNQNTNTRENIH
mgnify:CR=1 FL=1